MDQSYAAFESFDFLALTETWLCDGISDAELGFSQHSIYRKDRHQGTGKDDVGGGALIAVNRKYCSSVIGTVNSLADQIFVKVKTLTGNCIIGCAYFPPNSTLQAYINFTEAIETIFEQNPTYKYILLGDFNLPHTTWSIDNSRTYCNVNKSCEKSILNSSLLLSTVNYTNLFQINNIPNLNNRTLDLIFTSDKDTIVNRPVINLVPCDKHHPALDFYLTSNDKFVELNSDELCFDFNRADYLKINEELCNISWLPFFLNNSLDSSINYFYGFIYNQIFKYVPQYTKKACNYPAWYSSSLKKLLHSKHLAHTKYKSSQLKSDYHKFSNLRKQCKSMAKNDYSAYIRETEESIKIDMKSFWKFCNNKRGVSGLPNEVCLNDSVANSGQDIVNLFADYFESVYAMDDNQDLPLFIDSDPSLNLGQISLSQIEVFNKIAKLNPRKGAGPDGIPPSFIINCNSNITPMLHFLFNKSLSEGLFPKIWKSSFITPIFKSGSRSDVKNYRPISILSTIPKLFESIVTPTIYNFVNPNLIDEQYGFRQHRSTVSNLLSFQHFTLEKLGQGLQVNTIYTDFSKAFDSVNHNILVEKLKSFGIHGSLLRWLQSYLSQRTQNVKFKSYVSRDINVTSGVPQGSHLGPLLFLIFINDIKLSLTGCKFLLFADDLKIFHPIKSPLDCEVLRRDLLALSNWCQTNRLLLNISKCKVMSFSNSKNQISEPYFIDNVLLESVTSFKDLGVTFDNKLKFDKHVDRITNKSLQLLGFIRRMTTDFSDPFILRTLYLTLIRSILLYASPVWSPNYKNLAKRIETIQHKFLNFVAWKLHWPLPIYSHDYFQIANFLNLSSLKSVRIFNDIQYLYNLIHNLIDCPELLSKVNWRVPPRRMRQRGQLFHIPVARTNHWYHAPLWRMSRLVNDLQIDFLNLPPTQFVRTCKKLILVDFS